MQIPLQIVFHNLDHSDAVEREIADQVRKLERFFGRITGCQVVIEAPHGSKRKGKLYRVRVDLTVPRGELVVGRNPGQHAEHADVHLAIRDAFRATRRRLQDHADRHRGTPASAARPSSLEGKVAKLLPEQDGGLLHTSDGRELYFHRNAVAGGRYPTLRVGTRIRYREGDGETSPQAVRVTVARATPVR